MHKQRPVFSRVNLLRPLQPQIKIALRAVAGGFFLWQYASPVQAGNTWDGGGASSNWSDNANWNPDGQPAFGTLSFSGSTQTTNIMDQSYTMNQIDWNGSSAWVMNNANGATLSLNDNGGTQAKVESLGTGGVTINAPITFAATAGNNWGEINASGGSLTFATGTLTVNGSAVNGIQMNGGGNTTTFNNTVNATGKFFATTGSSDTVAVGGAFTSGDFYLMNNGTLNITGGTFAASAVRLGGDFGTTGTQDLSKGATLDLAVTTGGLTFGGVINSVAGNTSAALAINSQNTSGTNVFSGHVALDSNLTVNQSTGGTLNITQAHTDGATALTGTDLKGSTLTVSGGGKVSISGDLYNSTGSGTVVVNVTSTAAALTLSGTNTYTGGTSITGTGALNINSTTALGTGALTINRNSGKIDNTSGAAITLTNNNALILAANLLFNGSTTNDGTHDLNFGTGAVSVNGSRLVSTVYGGSTLTLGGVVSDAAGTTGALTFNAGVSTSTLALTGTSNTYSGNTTIQAGIIQATSIGNSGSAGSLGAGSGLIFSGNGNNPTVTPTLKYVGVGESTNRSIEIQAGQTNGGATFDASGTGALTLSGTVTVDPVNYSKNFVFQGSNTANNTMQSALPNPTSGTGTMSLVKNGIGTWVLSGASTYTNTTTVNSGKLTIDSAGTTTARLANTSGLVVNGGTLSLANSGSTASVDRINDAATVTLGGGTFNTGGLSEHGGAASGPGVTAGLGALTLQSSSIIDMGNGASILAFANSSAAGWSGTLKIYDWSGKMLTGNGTDQLFFGTSSAGLTTAQLGMIQFYSDAGVTPLGITEAILADGEVVPAPEPATWLGAAMTLGVAGYSLRRRFIRDGVRAARR